MKPANYTTTVTVDRSLVLISNLLRAAKAYRIMIEYEGDGTPKAVNFSLVRREAVMAFRMSPDWRRTMNVLNNSIDYPKRLRTPDHAKRVVWRTQHDWLRAQLGLIEIGVMELDYAMIPYAVTPTGETIAERFASQDFRGLLLGPGQTTN